ncbi:serine/threonine protein kinase [Streptomyces sp. NTH33]|uniref:serine/threonine-protein kinase n=1 Tax=Streptomyces sp. NTH33 TaxID=1735453 RepID=UPI000DA9EC61|nr:serine/threonine-protein kinase [Streptomyces sp. NTH33]PZH09155.1 serine/threonine protein kinase [Streptomyces sp. NTH33]
MAGRILAGRYQLDQLLGRGGMGEVWAAHDTVIRRHVAVKLLRPSEGDDGTDLFLREARMAGGLNHPGVVTIYDIGQEPDGTRFLVMELLHGRDLSAAMRDEGLPTLADALDWAVQTADALAAAHAARIVHRDLKPANLMLTHAGNIKILDFGIAHYTSTVTQASRIIGTPHYMPPERLLGKAGDGRGDLYSLGCLLHELLTGSTPFGDLDTVALMYAHLHRTPEPPSARSLDVPAALDQLVLALLAKDPDDRPSTADQVRDHLRALTVASSTVVHPKSLSAAVERAAGTPLPVVLGQSVRTADDSTHEAASGDTTIAAPVPVKRPRLADTLLESSPPYGLHASLPTPPVQGTPPTAPTVRALNPTKRFAAATSTPWTRKIGGSTLSAPVVADGNIYVCGSDDRVHALDAATGSGRWACAIRGYIGFHPSQVVVGGTIYIGGSPGVYALNAATGTEQWAYTTRDERFYPPVVADGTVYISSDGLKMYALDAATGAEQWVQSTSSRIESSPVVADGTVYVCSSNGRVYAMDAGTGGTRWTHRADAYSSPAVANGTVYFGSGDNRLYALDAATGTERWAHRAYTTLEASPVVVDGTVYLGCMDGLVHALDAATGAEQWIVDTADSSEHADDGDDHRSSPVVIERTVYITSNDGNALSALDATTGAKRWTHTSGNDDFSTFSTPAVANGMVYITKGDKAHALNATTGAGSTA